MFHVLLCCVVLGWCLQASSPDEEALVQGAAYLGYKLLSRTTEEVRVEIHGALHIFDVLATLEFNSDRKRMSIIVRTPDSRVLLMCKGADSIILKRLAAGEPGVETVMKHLVSTATTCPPAWGPLAACLLKDSTRMVLLCLGRWAKLQHTFDNVGVFGSCHVAQLIIDTTHGLIIKTTCVL